MLDAQDIPDVFSVLSPCGMTELISDRSQSSLFLCKSGSDSLVLVSSNAVSESRQITFYNCSIFTLFHFKKKKDVDSAVVKSVKLVGINSLTGNSAIRRSGTLKIL